MAIISHQFDVSPDHFDTAGTAEKTSIQLSVPGTVRYPDGSSDVLPAGVAALLPDTTTDFDRSTDAYVVYTEKGSGVLKVMKETDFITSFGGIPGTVTSVGLTAPGEFSVSGSPVTTTGNLGLSWVNEDANKVFSGPTTGSPGTPAFRLLVAADVPNLDASIITSGILDVARGGTGVDSSAASNGQLLIGTGSGLGLATLTAGANISITNTSGHIQIDSTGAGTGTVTSVDLAMPGEFSVSGNPITTSGTLTVTKATQLTNKVFAAPDGSTGVPTFRLLTANDIPSLDAAKITTGTFSAGLLPIATSSTLGAIKVGTTLSIASGVLDYTLPTASGSVLGGIKVGTTLSIASGVLDYTLPTASASVLGGIKVGSGLTITSGVLSTTGGGTVTSVALTAPSEITVAGSPITGSGTIGLTWTSETNNSVLAAPDGSAGVPTFRQLVLNDIPFIPSYWITGSFSSGSLPADVVYNDIANTFTTGPQIINSSMLASNQYGMLSVGDAPWDGTTTNHFLGDNNGTVLAVNTQASSGNLVDFQTGGVSKFKITVGSRFTTVGFDWTFRYTNNNGDIYSFLPDTIGLPGLSASSGTQNFFNLNPKIIQTSTAGYTGLLLNVTETTTGSGTKLLLDLEVGSSSKFKVDHSGNTTLLGTLTLPSQTANQVFAAPSGSSGVPGFRALVAADIPALSYVSSVAMTVPSDMSVSGSPISSSGTFGITRNAQSGNIVLASPSGGGSGTPTFRSLVAADIPNLDASQITTGTFSSARLPADVAYTDVSNTFSVSDASSSGTFINQTIESTLTQTGTAGYTLLKVSATETTIGSGTKLLLDLEKGGSSKFTVDHNGNLGVYGDITFNGRRIILSAGGFDFNWTANVTSSGPLWTVQPNGGSLAASANDQYIWSFIPTITQSGTAGYEVIRAEVTESSLGSGAKNLINLLVTSSSKFKVDNSGNTTIAGTLTLPSQSANFVFAAPSASSGTPGFRALVSGDVPSLDVSKITTGTFATSFIPNLDAAKITTGTLALAIGGTNTDNSSVTANKVWASPDGSTGAASYRVLRANDNPDIEAMIWMGVC